MSRHPTMPELDLLTCGCGAEPEFQDELSGHRSVWCDTCKRHSHPPDFNSQEAAIRWNRHRLESLRCDCGALFDIGWHATHSYYLRRDRPRCSCSWLYIHEESAVRLVERFTDQVILPTILCSQCGDAMGREDGLVYCSDCDRYLDKAGMAHSGWLIHVGRP